MQIVPPLERVRVKRVALSKRTYGAVMCFLPTPT